MRISDWSSDVCSSDLAHDFNNLLMVAQSGLDLMDRTSDPEKIEKLKAGIRHAIDRGAKLTQQRSEEHTSELQSLMRISYAVFCLKKKITSSIHYNHKYLKSQKFKFKYI